MFLSFLFESLLLHSGAESRPVFLHFEFEFSGSNVRHDRRIVLLVFGIRFTNGSDDGQTLVGRVVNRRAIERPDKKHDSAPVTAISARVLSVFWKLL